MTITEIAGQSFHYARTCRWLWIFGFFVGAASSNGGSGGGGGNAGGGLELSVPVIAALVLAAVVVLVVATIVRFVSEGALVEGIVRARQGGRMRFGDAVRAGWTHWGVLFRIAIVYLLATVASLLVLGAPCVLAFAVLGVAGGVAVTVPVLVVLVPWLTTLYLGQAFASRIAVIEHRHALDAIQKARLFLHGRLLHGLKLIAATLVGTIAMVLIGVVVLLPVVLLLVGLVQVLPVAPVVIVGAIVVLPAFYVVMAMVGTYRSAVWTLGYVTQVES